MQDSKVHFLSVLCKTTYYTSQAAAGNMGPAWTSTLLRCQHRKHSTHRTSICYSAAIRPTIIYQYSILCNIANIQITSLHCVDGVYRGISPQCLPQTIKWVTSVRVEILKSRQLTLAANTLSKLNCYCLTVCIIAYILFILVWHVNKVNDKTASPILDVWECFIILT